MARKKKVESTEEEALLNSLGNDPSLVGDDDQTTLTSDDGPEDDAVEDPARSNAIPEVSYHGSRTPCPHCKAKLLSDRITQACVVMQTRDGNREDGEQVKVRYMQCRFCGKTFNAIESTF